MIVLIETYNQIYAISVEIYLIILRKIHFSVFKEAHPTLLVAISVLLFHAELPSNIQRKGIKNLILIILWWSWHLPKLVRRPQDPRISLSVNFKSCWCIGSTKPPAAVSCS